MRHSHLRQLVLASSVALLGLLSGCGILEAILRSLPAARTPVLETVFNADSRQVVPMNPSADFSVGIAGRLELRVRAPARTRMIVNLDNISLPEVRDGAAHPEFAQSGYFRVSNPVPVSPSDPLEFWRVLVVLPTSTGPISPFGYAVALKNVSLNSRLTGSDLESPPLLVRVRPTFDDNATRLPSDVFFDPPDNKHTRSALIARGVTVAGWIVDATAPGDEDVHSTLLLDNDFIERNYRASDPTLSTAVMPGRCHTDLDCLFFPNERLPLTDGRQPNAGTFNFPGQPALTLELNTWHVSKNKGLNPARWMVSNEPGHTDFAYPFNPRFGVTGTQQIEGGSYVIVSGALVEDSAHLHWDAPPPNVDLNDIPDYRRGWCWQRKRRGHGGWLEIHPFDSMRLVAAADSPRQRKHAVMVELCDPDDGRPVVFKNVLIEPAEPPPTDRSLLQFKELIDPRFTDMDTVTTHSVSVDQCDSTKLRVNVAIKRAGWFMATYLLWWAEGPTARPPKCVTHRPPGPIEPWEGDPDDKDPSACRLRPHLPQCNSDAIGVR